MVTTPSPRSLASSQSHLTKIHLSDPNQIPSLSFLVGGFNPSEKYSSKWDHLPQIRVKIKKYLSWHHLDLLSFSWNPVLPLCCPWSPWVSPQSCEGHRRPLKGALWTAQYEFTSAQEGLLKDQVVYCFFFQKHRLLRIKLLQVLPIVARLCQVECVCIYIYIRVYFHGKYGTAWT